MFGFVYSKMHYKLVISVMMLNIKLILKLVIQLSISLKIMKRMWGIFVDLTIFLICYPNQNKH